MQKGLGMKVEDLKNLGLDEETIKKVQALSGADVTAAKNASQSQIDSLTGQITELQEKVTQRETDLSDVKSQLEKAGQSYTKLAEVQNNLYSLQTKYVEETNAYKTKLEDQKYEFMVRERANDIKFSCNAAKKEFISDLMKNRLPVQDDSLLGFDDYTAKQMEADPDAFKKEPKEEPPAQKSPQFAPAPNPNNTQTPPPQGDGFHFDFLGVREHKN